MTSRFEADTAVQRIGSVEESRAGLTVGYLGRIDHSWWIMIGPNGGYIGAIVARAICDAAGDATRRLSSLTVHYLRVPAEGACEIEVHVERVGRRVSSVTARLIQAGQPIVLGIASLSVPQPSLSFDGLVSPEVPEPDSILLPPDSEPPPIEMAQHFDNRPVFGNRLGSLDSPGVARTGGWMRYLDPTPVDEVVLVALADAWWPPLMEVSDEPMAAPTVDLTVHIRSVPADPLQHVLGEFTSPLAGEGHTVEDGRLWSRTGRLLAESRQLAVLL